MINFNSNKIIIVCFPKGAGGKFLINCLGLSNSCVFQHAELANLQLDGNFTLQDKLAYLHDKLNNMTEIWNDLDLHFLNLFGINEGEHMNKSTEDISYNSIIETITNAGVFDASTSGNLFVKGDFTGLTLAAGDSIQFTFKVIFN